MATHILFTAIDKYNRGVFGDKIDLKGTVLDIQKAEGFLPQESNCRYLLDEKAKKQVLIDTLKTFALEAQPGDTFIWYHSSHGTYMDAWDGRRTARVVEDDILWDWEVAPLLGLFQAGVVVIVVSDCCHAESNSRSVTVPPSPDARPKAIPIEFVPVAKANVDSKIPASKSKVKYNATIYHISACKAGEVAWETGSGGAFTQTLAIALRAYKKPTRITTLIDAVRKNLARQTPKVEVINGLKAAVPKW